MNAVIAVSNAYREQVNIYNEALVTYNAALTKYNQYRACVDNGDCQGDYSKYATNFNRFKNEVKTWKNGCQYSSNPSSQDQGGYSNYCNNDYPGWKTKRYNKDLCSLALQVNAECVRGDATLTADWKAWAQTNVRPIAPAPTAPTPPSFNSQQNIVCCSQQFSNITAGQDINLDVVQNCRVEVENIVNNPTGQVPNPNAPPPTLTPTKTNTPTPTPTPSNTIPIIIGASVGAFVLLLIIIIAVVVRRNRRNAQ